MISWFKKYFIPHEHNEHKPHLLRTQVTVFILGIILFAELLFLIPTLNVFTKSDFFAAIFSIVLVDSTNSERQKVNEPTLKINPLLEEAARLKAEDMAKKEYFAHTSPEGISPWFWLKKVGYNYSRAGENLAVHFVDSQDVVNAWMKSPSHKANILNENYTEIGIATAKGIYKGSEGIFVVQFFGRPVSNIKLTPSSATATTQIVVTTQPSESKTLPAETSITQESDLAKTQQYSSFTQKVLTQPKTLIRNLLFAFMIVIDLALLLTVLIKREFQYSNLILNGLIMFVIMTSLVLLNQYITTIHSGIS
ncbi:MAG: hypothetical protein HYW77_02100 [Parcubacteria group bacterium]|nr:hypothetical protein [Parcubacteria group bacterium]